MATSASSGAASLVASVKKNMKFRQLAGYSVQSLAKLITAPSVGWERNLREAYEAGALAAITEVLARHTGDEEVTAAAVAALTAIATESAYAIPLIESGAIMGLLESVLKNPDAKRGVRETIVLFENAATSAPNALLMAGGLDAAARLIDCARVNENIAPACARVVEKLIKDPSGPAAFLECEGIPSILGLVVESRDSTALDVSFKILDRMARTSDYIPIIRDKNDGLKILCTSLARLPATESAAKSGSRVLAKLASSNVGELLSTMLMASSVEREFLASLISTLVLEEDFAEKLLSNGGLLALLKVFGSGTVSTSEAVAKALTRLIVLDEHANAVVEASAIERVVSVMTNNLTATSLQAACTSLLLRITALSQIALARVDNEGGVEAVVRALASHATSEQLATVALSFFESIVTRPGEGSLAPERLVQLDALKCLAAALVANPSRPLVQLNGSYVFVYCSGGVVPVRKMIDAGVHNAVVANLATPSDDTRKDWKEPSAELIAATMYLATQFALLDEGKAALSGEATEAIMSAVSHYTRSMGDVGASSAIGTVAEVAEQLMMAIVTEKQVTSTLSQLLSTVESVADTKSRAEAGKLRSIVTSVCAFAANATFARILVRSDGIEALLHTIELISSTTGFPDGERILTLATNALSSILSSTEDAGDVSGDAAVMPKLLAAGAPAKLIGAVKAAPKLTRFVCAALDIITRLVGDEATAKALTSQEGGAVEAVAAVLRANPHSGAATISAVSALLAMSDEDTGAVAVAKLGGTRQVLASINSNIGAVEFFPALERSLALISRTALVTEGAELIVRQGGVDVIIEAAASLARHGDDGAAAAEETLDALMKVLSRLLTRADVLSTAEAALSMAQEAKLGGALDSDKLRAGLIKLPIIGSVPRFAEMVRAAGVESSLAAIVTNLMTSQSEDSAISVGLPLAFKSLAALAKSARLQTAPALLLQASTAVRNGKAVPEALEFIKSCAAFSEDEALRLCRDGSTLPLIVSTLQNHLSDKAVSAACFRALAALGGHPSTVASLAATSALALAKEWLADNAEDASEESVAAALSCLGALAGKGGRGDTLVSSGLLESVKSVLVKRCSAEATAPAPLILGAAVNVLSAVARLEAAMAARLASSGVLSRVVRSMTHTKGYSKNEGTVVAACDFFSAAANAGGDLATELMSSGAIDVVLAGMSANGTNDRVLAAGGEALEAMGAGEEAARVALEEVRALNSNAADTGDIGQALQRLSNLSVVRGVITAATAENLLDAALDSLELMIESPSVEASALAAALQAVGRIVERGASANDSNSPRAVDAVLAAIACRRGANLSVRTAAVHSLGQLVASRPAADAIMLANGIQVINVTAKKHAKDTKLQTVAAAAIKKITSAATRFAAGSLHSVEGLATLASLLSASVGDPDALAIILGEIIGSPGGMEALFALIADGTLSNDIMGIVLASINAAHTPEKGEATHNRVGALIRAIEDAMMQSATITSRSSANAKFRAIKITDSSLGLLAKTEWTGASASRFILAGGLDKLISLLKSNWEDPETTQKIMAVIRGLTTPRDLPGEALARFGPHMRTMNEGLRRLGKFSSLAAAADNLDSVAALATLMPAEDRVSWQKDSMRSAALLARGNPGSARIMNGVRALEFALGEKIADSDAAVKAFMAQLLLLVPTISPLGSLQEIPSEEAQNRSYFFDPSTNETTWVAPLAMSNFKSTLAVASSSAIALEDDAVVGAVDSNSMSLLIGALKGQIRSPMSCAGIVNVLAALSLNEENALLLGELEGILAMIAAANAHPNDLVLLKSVLTLMERIARVGKFREVMAEKGGVDLIANVAIGIHVELEDICLLALMCSTNLSVDSAQSVELMMQKGIVSSVEKALQSYPSHSRILQESMSVLTNLMFGSNENKLIIGQACGDEITGVIRDFPADTPLVKQALKALGNLSFCDENVRFIAEEHHATKAIVACMRAHATDEEVQELAMDVFSNFAASNEGPVQRNSDGEIVHTKDSIPSIILREAGCAQCISALKTWRTAPLMLIVALRTLATIASDSEVAETMCERQSLLTIVLDVAALYAVDSEVLAAVFQLFSAVTKSKAAGLLLVQLDAIALLFSSMEQHRRDPDMLRFAQLTLTHLSVINEGRDVMLAMDGISSLLALIEECTTYRTYVIEAMATLLNLCGNDALSRKIAESGMHIIISLMDQYEEDTDFLSGAFRLLGHLAFLESNLAIIVQHNGVPCIIRAITLHPDSRNLMVRAIQTIDNIAMKNREYAGIVVEEGGKELIETILATYSGDEEMRRHGKSALLAISSLEGLTKSAEITAKAAKARKQNDDKRAVDPLGEFRNVLAAGKVLKVWTKGSSVNAHVLAAADFKSIVWQDVGSQRKLGALELKAVLAVKKGCGDGHKKGMLSLMGKAADEDLAFSVIGDRNSLDLEAKSSKERETWFNAFEKLLAVYRTNPEGLTPK